MKNDYKSMPLFKEIPDPALRTWNRYNVLNNIKEDLGSDAAIEYCSLLDSIGRVQLIAMIKYVAVRGIEQVKTEITGGLHSVK